MTASPGRPRASIPIDNDQPRPLDVTTLGNLPQRRWIIPGLWPEKAILGIVGEEGDGKTWLGDQIIRQLLRGDRVLDFFDLGDIRPTKVLFIETEMEEDDAKDQQEEMTRRGIGVEAGQLYWWCIGGLNLADPGDIEMVRQQIDAIQPDLVWIDSAINAVTDASEEVYVKPFFNALSMFMRMGVRGIGLTLHPRKGGQEQHGRRFDDLFGSREWKGRTHTVLHIDTKRMTVWKNRGGAMRRRLGVHGRYPAAALNRVGLSGPEAVPFTLALIEDDAVDDEVEIEAAIRDRLAKEPGVLTKTDLAEALGKSKEDGRAAIARMQASGEVVPDTRGAKLRLADVEPTAVSQDAQDSSQERSL